MSSVTVKFKRNHNNAVIPTKSTKGAACYDVVIPEDNKPLTPGEIRIINLGFSVEVPNGYELQVRCRSGLATKGCFVVNGVGCIDSDYRGDVGVILGNMSQGIIPLSRGTRIAQLKLSSAPDIDWEVIDEVSETERGSGGYGSTGGM